MGNKAAKEFENGMQAKREKNYDEAYQCFRIAAKQGHAEACNELGECYFYGNGTDQNHEKALKWYKKAAKAGNPDAQGNVGYCYANGIGTTQDYARSVKWLKRAAEQNNGNAQLNLGNRYHKGQGVKKNLSKAEKYYLLATQNGAPMGYLMAGILYYIGFDEIQQDYQKAYELISKCVEETNHRQARYMMGKMLLLGQGVEKNLAQARVHLCVSALQGYSDAVSLIEKNEQLFDAEITNAFYHWLMGLTAKADDMMKAPDLQLFAISAECAKRGMEYAETIGIIASRLFELATERFPQERLIEINFIGLATKWVLKK